MISRLWCVAFALLAAGFVFFAPLPYVTPFIYIGINALVCIGLVLLTGVAGLTSFGQAAFCGLGAYATALATTALGWPPLVGLAVSLSATAAVALMLGLLTVRLAGHYLVLGTLAWGMGLFYVFGNLSGLGGFNGISGLPPIELFGLNLNAPRRFVMLTWALVALALVGAVNLLDSRIGRAIRALPSQTMAESLGVSAAWLKVTVFVIAAVLAGLAGWLQAHFVRLVNPGPFGVNASIDYLFMVVIGGSGSLMGALAGSAVVELLKMWLRDLAPWLTGRTGSYEIIVFGVLVIVLLQNAPGGLAAAMTRWLPARWRMRSGMRSGMRAGMRAGLGADGDLPPLPCRQPPSAGAPLLQVEGATRRFGGLVAVNGVSFNVSVGEILAVIGPNGAGKSTLFALLSGLLPLSAGSVRFMGRRIDGTSPHRIAASGIARSFQHVVLRPTMSVRENVALGAHLRGEAGVLSAVFRLDRVEEARLLAEADRQIARVGLSDLADQPAGTLALGQQRLLEVARALAADPLLLLLDEPAAGLRLQERERLADLLRDLRKAGLTILLVEHDMAFVMSLADRLVVMDFGERIAEGSPAEIRADPRVIEAYLGVGEEPA